MGNLFVTKLQLMSYHKNYQHEALVTILLNLGEIYNMMERCLLLKQAPHVATEKTLFLWMTCHCVNFGAAAVNVIVAWEAL